MHFFELKEYPEISPEWILQQDPEGLVFPDYSKKIVGYKINGYENAEGLGGKVLNNTVFAKTDAVKKEQV